MTTQHTPEPWRVCMDECDWGEGDMHPVNYHGWGIVAGDGYVVATAPDECSHPVSDDCIFRDNFKENARRIVACVNACAGIATEKLEGRGMLWFADEAYKLEDRLQERDRLADQVADQRRQLSQVASQSEWQAAEIDRLAALNAELVALLKSSDWPIPCTHGTVELGDYGQEECGFCYARSEAIAKAGVK